MARVAVNVCDLTRHPQFIVSCLLGDVVPNRLVVKAEPGKVDGSALVLECEELRARSLVQVLRDADKRMGQYATRCYVEGARGGWSRIDQQDQVTISQD